MNNSSDEHMNTGKQNAFCIDQSAVRQAGDSSLSPETVFELADLFKVFGDSTRLKLLTALSSGELCVCDLAMVLGVSQSAVSHQLRTLKQARLVRYRREGKVVYYALDDEHVETIIQQGLEHILHK